MPDTSSTRVLLVEDSGVLAGRITELIRRLPRVDLIGTVDTEADAVQRIASAAPDVLILDLHLRDGSGFGVLRSGARASGGRGSSSSPASTCRSIGARPRHSASMPFSTSRATITACRCC
jgi:CheY-like chemotaxis protein